MIKKESIVRDISEKRSAHEQEVEPDLSFDETAFAKRPAPSDEMKIKLISNHFRRIIQALGLDPDDDNLRDTPERIGAMYVKDMFRGLEPANKPAIHLFENKHHYSEIVVEKNITVYSYCECYFSPFAAQVQVAYIPRKKAIGSASLKQLLQYHSSKPQSKEKLVEEISLSLKDCLATQDVAVIVEIIHRHYRAGDENDNSSAITMSFSGKFQNEDTKRELFSFLK